jgi:signal transduction histidine kinase
LNKCSFKKKEFGEGEILMLFFSLLLIEFWQESWFGLAIAFTVLLSVIIFSIVIFKVIKNFSAKNITINPSAKDDSKLLAKIKELEEKNKQLTRHIVDKENQIKRLQKASIEISKVNMELKDQTDKLDVSNRESQTLQLKKDDLLKEKEELFGAMMHDIKNPVSLIRGFAELLNSYDLSRQEQTNIIQAIMETSDRMVVLSDEMGKLIAIDTQDLILSKEPLLLNSIVDSVIKANKQHALKKEITVYSNLQSSMPKVLADAVRIEEVIDNLLSNALKYTSHKGRVEIFSEVSANDLIIHFKDNGLGLSEEEIKKVFNPLQRLSPRPTDNEPSSGVGLSISKRIIEMHGGRIWVKSKIGEGSTFSISIPISWDK